jgi:hypothetical protein
MRDKQLSQPLFAVTAAAAAAFALLIFFWAGQRSPELAYDDAFITYRYADNLRQGLGLVYNPGQWVLGTTTPLFALLLAGLGLVVQNLAALGYWLGALAWAVAAWLALALFHEDDQPWAGLAAGLLVALLPAYLFSLGMETPLVVALMLAVAVSWLGGRKRLTVVLAGALLLVRHDSALWLLVLGLEIWRRERRLPWREAAGATLLTLPWFLYAWLRYGSPLPNSAAAKVGQNDLMPVTGQPPFWQGFWQALTASLPLLTVLVLLAALALGLWVVARRHRGWLWLPGWTLAYVAVYTLLGVVSFPWYFVPPLVTTLLLAALGIGHLAAGTNRATGLARWLQPGIALAAVLVLGITLAGQMSSSVDQPGTRLAYRPAGQWLAANTPDDAAVAAIEIGVIGYESGRPILDTMGLVSPDMTDHQVGWTETLIYALNAHQPAYAVILPATSWDQLLEKWWFHEEYRPAAAFDEVTVYQYAPQAPSDYLVAADFSFVDGLQLIGAEFSGRELLPGQNVTSWLSVAVTASPPVNYQLTTFLVDSQTAERYAITTTDPFDGLYHSQHWQPGDRLRLPARLMVTDDLPAGTYRLGVLFYDPRRDGGLPLTTTPETASPDVHIGWLVHGRPPDSAWPPGGQERPVQVHWQSGIELTALWLPEAAVAPGAILPVGLAWRTEAWPDRDLTVFVHLIDAAEQIVAQLDRRPFDGRWPAPAWQPGEGAYQDLYDIELPADLAPGRYHLRLGLYDAAGRLPLADGPADYWLLDQAVVIGP